MSSRSSRTLAPITRSPSRMGAAPAEVGAAVHRVDAGQAADVAGDDPIHREEDRGRRHAGAGPEGVAVADAVGPVADGVAAGDLDVGLRPSHGAAHQGSQRGERVVGDRGKAHGVSWLRVRSAWRSTLPAGVRGSASTKRTCRGNSWRPSRPRTCSCSSAAQRGVGVARDDPRQRDLAAPLVGHADHRGLAHLGMGEQRLLDLERAERPARRDDDVVRAAAVVDVALGVHPAAVLHEKPLALAPDGDLAGLAGRHAAGASPRPPPRPPSRAPRGRARRGAPGSPSKPG